MPMSKTKAQKKRERKARNSKLAHALVELDRLGPALRKIHPANGDVLLFKLQDGHSMTRQMVEAFLQVLSDRGVKDVQAFLMKPGDTIERISAAAFDQLARLRGYTREADHASREQSIEESGGNSGASPGEAVQAQPEPSGDGPERLARLCSNAGEGVAREVEQLEEAEGLRIEEALRDSGITPRPPGSGPTITGISVPEGY